jgi:hypothetical protein
MEMAVKLMETAVEAMESMEMAPRALPHPARVPEQRLLSLEIGLRRRRCCRTLLGETLIDLGFSRRRLYIGGGAMSEVDQAPHTMWWHGPGGMPPYGVAGPCPPPSALLRTSSRVGKNRRFGLRFVQFREYFPCNFSETQKQQKTRNWHCGISLIG